MAWETCVRAGALAIILLNRLHTNALDEYERAIALDPNFAYARAEMSLEMVCDQYGGLAADRVLPRAKSEARRALSQ